MLKPSRTLSFFALLALLPPAGFAGQDAVQPEAAVPAPSAEAMLLDGLIYRPISLASTILGTGVFLITLPFSAAGGNVGSAGERLVVEPARNTFGRCLGCLPQDN